jgi:hypothetical protein
MPLDTGGWANLNAIDEELDCVPEGALARCLGILEQ